MAKFKANGKLVQHLELETKKPLLDNTILEESTPEKTYYVTEDWLSSWPIWLRVLLFLTVILLVAAIIWQYLSPVKIWQVESRNPLEQMDLKKEATMLYKQSQLKEAIPKLEHLVQENPNDLKLREMLVSSYWQQGKLAAALKHNSILVKRQRYDADSLYRQGLLALQLNKFKTAVKYLEQAAEQSPNSSNYHAELARALTKDKQYDRAINEWEYVLDILASDSNAAKSLVWQQIADIYSMKGDKQKAIEAIKKGLEVNPNNEILKKKLQIK